MTVKIMLNSEVNTQKMERRIVTAFKHHAWITGLNSRRTAAVFEHGHWWIVTGDGAQYDAVDANGHGSVDGFDFEYVGGRKD
jgi:hypothetical protein